LRLVRDAFSIPGQGCLDSQGGVGLLMLSRLHPLSVKLLRALQQLFAPLQTRVCLGEI